MQRQPFGLLDTSMPPSSDDDLDDGEYAIEAITGRRWRRDKKGGAYEYRVKWLGYADDEQFRTEADLSAARLISEYDGQWPRGSTKVRG